MKKLVIFGKGDIAQIANYYFEIDSEYEVVAFTLHKEYITEDSYEDKPMVSFESIEVHYPVENVEVFVALSYAEMNHFRQRICSEVKNKGYKLASYISSKCTYLSQFPPGENAFIFEDNTIQPFVKIGDNVTLWSGNHIGHHSKIESNNFISSHVVISGHCIIEENCFLGVNSTVGHNVTLSKETLLGAGAVISKKTEENSIYVPPRTLKLEKKSTEIKL
jgi:sugar O-acyltransferase (sialic acid O-acetyltransferase NeuD family)